MNLPAPSRPRLLLHLGPHKTGSTAIQHHCAAVRAELAQAGFCYPRAACWNDQHLMLPGSMIVKHPFVPPDLLGKGPEPVLAAIAVEVPAGQVTLLSSEVFWELLMNQPRKAAELFQRLAGLYELSVVWVERAEPERLWSSIKHLARCGLPLDVCEHYAGQLQRNRLAAERLAALGCPVLRLPYPADGGDVVETFLAALPGAAPAAVAGLVAQRRALAAGRPHVNAAPRQPHAAAFSFEFARRLQALPRGESRPSPAYASLLDQAIHHPQALAAWQELPGEPELRRRLEAAAGQPGSLLLAAERSAWEASLASDWFVALAAGLDLAGTLQDLRHPPE
jgi:hypothetical protein